MEHPVWPKVIVNGTVYSPSSMLLYLNLNISRVRILSQFQLALYIFYNSCFRFHGTAQYKEMVSNNNMIIFMEDAYKISNVWNMHKSIHLPTCNIIFNPHPFHIKREVI